MKQQCHISMIYLSWAIFAAGLAFLAWRSLWAMALGWLIFSPLLMWLYVRKFPAISPLMGYGPITDEKGAPGIQAPIKVTLYTALGCPFCPLVEERLVELQKQVGFVLKKVDVTLRPDLLASKGIRSVPVVEVGNRLLPGLQSTKDLASAITRS